MNIEITYKYEEVTNKVVINDDDIISALELFCHTTYYDAIIKAEQIDDSKETN